MAETPSFTFPSVGAAAYRSAPELRETGEDIRNAWFGVYTDTTDLDAAGNPKRKSTEVFDAVSSALYDQAVAKARARSNDNPAPEAVNVQPMRKASGGGGGGGSSKSPTDTEGYIKWRKAQIARGGK